MLCVTACAGLMVLSDTDDSEAASTPTYLFEYGKNTSKTLQAYATSYTFVSGSVPTGLSLSYQAGTGNLGNVIVSGTPTVANEETKLTLKITTNLISMSTSTYTFNFIVTPSGLSDTVINISEGESLSLVLKDYQNDTSGLGLEYGSHITTFDSGLTLTYGLTFNYDSSSQKLMVTGTPTSTPLHFAVRIVSDSAVLVDEVTEYVSFTINVGSEPTWSVSDAIVISGAAFSKQVCDKDITSVSGCDWLSFTGGTLSGTAPTVTSTTTYNVTVYSGEYSQSFTLQVIPKLAFISSPVNGAITYAE